MAKQVTIMQPQDIANLKRAHAALTEFLASNGEIKAPTQAQAQPAAKRSHHKKAAANGKPGLTKAGKPRKPTGAAAHKANLAKAQGGAANGGGKQYPAIPGLNEAVEAKQEEAAQVGSHVAGTDVMDPGA